MTQNRTMIPLLAVAGIIFNKSGIRPAKSTLYLWMQTGKLRTYRIGGRNFTTADDIDEFLERNPWQSPYSKSTPPSAK